MSANCVIELYKIFRLPYRQIPFIYDKITFNGHSAAIGDFAVLDGSVKYLLLNGFSSYGSKQTFDWGAVGSVYWVFGL